MSLQWQAIVSKVSSIRGQARQGIRLTLEPVKVMKRYNVSLPEAMTVITRARLKRVKPTLLPSQRIVDLLHNDNHLRQLDIWQACEFNIFENMVLNPNDPREEWIVEKVGWDTEKEEKKMGAELLPVIESVKEKLPLISEHPHRLSTIAEVEKEIHRLSMISEGGSEEHHLKLPALPLWMP